MAKQPPISPQFLADLDVVSPQPAGDSLPSTFLNDLEIAYAHAQAISPQEPVVSLADLTSLEDDLQRWRSYHQQLLQRYLAQVPDDDPLRCPVSLFGTMDYGRLETAHTRALAWLLSHKEHGFGFQLLEALLLHLLEGRAVRLTSVNKVESEYTVSCGPTYKEGGRLDIFAEGRWEEMEKEISWRLVIEAKIDAAEGEEQLSLYDGWLEADPSSTEVFRVFLTPDEREPQTGSAEWKALSFSDLASVFRRSSAGLQDRPGYHFLRYYLTGVLRDVCRLPIPLSPDCDNPYAANEYLQTVLGVPEAEAGHGHSR
jgi:hypothetical protein